MRRSTVIVAARAVTAFVVFGVVLLGQGAENERVFNASPEATWTVAVSVAKEAFLADRISNDEGRLRLRAGPLRAYAFDVLVKDAGGGKTRVQMVLRTASTMPVVKRDAQRNAERYFGILRQRLEQQGRK